MKNNAPYRSVAGRTDENVPVFRSERDRIHSAAADIASSEELTVPVGLEDLLPRARKLLEDLGLSEKYIHYATVILSNALWRDPVASISRDRRLLLLPQCLRDPECCPAGMDQYGLSCTKCGRCNIGRLLEEAESLGYVCLVTEGTAVVMSLIESGKIEAVIGVGCLESLEKVFPYMLAGGVPGLAIPLLRSGCSNTEVDIDRLLEAVYHSGDGRTISINTQKLACEIDAWFNVEELRHMFDDPAGSTARIAIDWLAAGGKRWRPLLTVCAHEALNPSGGKLPDYLHSIAVAVECFHKASLVHDDIEDDDAERYGRRTVHAAHGIPAAINVGDYLVGEGYRLLAGCGLQPQQLARMASEAAKAHRLLCMGQGEELALRGSGIPPVKQVIEISRLKTAPAFEVALKLGIIAAGRGDEFDEVISKFSEAIGIAYQLQDDLADVDNDQPANILKSLACEFPEENIDGAVRRAGMMIGRYEDFAAAVVTPVREPGLKILLHRIMARIFSQPMECCNDPDRRDNISR